MKRRPLLLGSALLCLFTWVEPGLAQYSMRCIEFCNARIGAEGPVRVNKCLHMAPICTGQPAFPGVPASKNPSGPAQTTAAQRAAAQTTAADRKACGADVGKLCQGIKPGGGRLWACLAARRNALSAACEQMVARHGL